jgi:DNA ligase (NAD+)
MQRKIVVLPSVCPSCNNTLVWNGVHLQCKNEYCPAQVQARILYWLNTMARIDALGENILVPFIKDRKWESIIDIYSKPFSELYPHQIMLSKHSSSLIWDLCNKLYKEPVNPARFFEAFGLPAVGGNTAKRIAEEIGIDEFFKDDFEIDRIWELSRITEPAVVSLWDNWDAMRNVYQQIKLAQGFITTEKQGKTMQVTVTGKLSKSRKEIETEFAKHGVTVAGSVNKEVSYLITDDPTSGSSKNKTAQKLEVKVVSETEFRKIMGW